MVARMVVSRDMVLDALRGERFLLAKVSCSRVVAASVPRGGKPGQPLGLGCKCLPYVS